jgi:hypothetical protein
VPLLWLHGKLLKDISLETRNQRKQYLNTKCRTVNEEVAYENVINCTNAID